ncbi:hypothetical protein IIC38_11340, partial [candidate division KSB1 bacterium]|nr:hypothetical protein [candidate division KSB1 bacterium]
GAKGIGAYGIPRALIPSLALVFYNYIQGKIARNVFEMEESSYSLLEMVREKEIVKHEI